MKTMKKLMALVLGVVMMLAMTVSAFADGTTTNTISVPASDTHSYSVYQIFTGDLSTDGKLSNVKWGANGTGTKGEDVAEDVLNELTSVDANASDTEKLAVIEKYFDSTSESVGTVTNTSTYEAATGYYLIKDATDVDKTDAYTKYIVKVVGDVEITRKADVPTFVKKVQDTNDSNGTTSDWQDSADYDIGDAVPFKLTGTVADNMSSYKSDYYFAFSDTMDASLDFNTDSVVVKVDGVENTSDWKIKVNDDKHGFTLSFADLKTVDGVKDGSVITVEYTATLNASAVTGSQGQINTGKLIFSNNPNSDQGGENGPTGETPEDTVIVFTYEFDANKVDENLDPLKGAGFTLYKKASDGTYAAIGDEVKGEDLTTFTWKGIDDGDYKLVETTTPDGYNTISPIEFTVSATHKETTDVTTERTSVLTALSATKADGSTLATGDVGTGILETQVINQSGSTLPSTGGMGTTMFYIIGGILMVGAAVILISRRRMSK